MQVVAGDDRHVRPDDRAHQRLHRALGVVVARWSGRRRAARNRRRRALPRAARPPTRAIMRSKNACSTGPFGSAIASRIGTGSQAPAASMSAMKPGIRPAYAGRRSGHRRPSPAAQQRRVAKSASRGEGAKRLHSMEKPSRAMRGPRHSIIPSSSAMRGVAFSPLPVSTSTVVCSGLIVPGASSLANAAAAWARVGST